MTKLSDLERGLPARDLSAADAVGELDAIGVSSADISLTTLPIGMMANPLTLQTMQQAVPA
ncbi:MULTISPECIES: hypothetical protein [unclassified Mesorhizobium]|uniref:hypothetical protein n=1 Tax=unclassified Mesorhizobium TaxID=325217 RepID=UPI001FE23803|nr:MULTISPECIES: hypothetical protein [unclassified Mesorhizobium]